MIQIAIFSIAIIIISAPSYAGDLDLQLASKNKSLCYARGYSSDHLDAHPDQLTRSMRIKLSSRADLRNQLEFMIEAHLGKSNKKLTIGGICRYDKAKIAYECFGDCESGEFTVSQIKNSNSILLKLDWLRVCSGNVDLSLNPGKDDREFRLDVTAISACTSMKFED